MKINKIWLKILLKNFTKYVRMKKIACSSLLFLLGGVFLVYGLCFILICYARGKGWVCGVLVGVGVCGKDCNVVRACVCVRRMCVCVRLSYCVTGCGCVSICG